jgi:hypothetical protein
LDVEGINCQEIHEIVNIIGLIKSGKMRWSGVMSMREMSYWYRILVGNHEEKEKLVRARRR